MGTLSFCSSSERGPDRAASPALRSQYGFGVRHALARDQDAARVVARRLAERDRVQAVGDLLVGCACDAGRAAREELSGDQPSALVVAGLLAEGD